MTSRELEKLIPGLAEVRAKERAARLLPWITDERNVCGVWVRQLTLRHSLELEFAGNRFFVGDESPDRADAYLLLWRLSGSFKRRVVPLTPTWFARRRVRKAAMRRSANYLVREIRAFIKEQEQDRPPVRVEKVQSGGVQQERQHHWAADYINFFGEVYGWSRDTALDTPLPVMNQLYRAHHQFHGSPIPSFSEADRLIARAVKAAHAAVTAQKGMT